MATYAIGDVHGCFETLRRLLRRCRFDPRADRLWLVGDLVNRGPSSLAVLRWAVEHDHRVVTVLGNHDLHLLARAAGVSEARRRDTLEEVLAAPDRDDLLAWLRRRPLLHRKGRFVLVHAGLFPAWTVELAETVARETEEALRGPSAARLLAAVERKQPERWKNGLDGLERARVALAGFTRLRRVSEDGRTCPELDGQPEQAPRGCRPWYELRRPEASAAEGPTVLFGHWAALGFRRLPGAICLDSACAWGRSLTALRLDDSEVFQEPAGEEARHQS
jgi:bis(5'-nucleosyl)-tetraphosphatase (symmetrical)